MDRYELVEILHQARVPDALYDIPDVQDIRVQPDAYYFLRPERGRWVVGLRERSQDSVLGRFRTEDEACRDLYARLVAISSSPAPDAPQRIEEVLARREEIRRRAWGAFERAPSKGDPRDRQDRPPSR